MSRIRADQYEQGELASRRAGTRIREIRGFSFSSQSCVVRGSTSSLFNLPLYESAVPQVRHSLGCGSDRLTTDPLTPSLIIPINSQSVSANWQETASFRMEFR